ncbi:MAG: hypothetical protein NZM04_10495 [Methylacidiphilales bacterium]|nr:hypothetical protein [Candidatus Methylacidiphilales bacterium]MDW8349051.1 hypothetical protein [Verrucomicrobiae bacterium]
MISKRGFHYALYLLAQLALVQVGYSSDKLKALDTTPAKLPDFTTFENQAKKALYENKIQSNTFPDYSKLQNQLIPYVIYRNRNTEGIHDQDSDHHKNWLYKDLEKLKEARAERQKLNSEDNIQSDTQIYLTKNPDVFSLGLNSSSEGLRFFGLPPSQEAHSKQDNLKFSSFPIDLPNELNQISNPVTGLSKPLQMGIYNNNIKDDLSQNSKSLPLSNSISRRSPVDELTNSLISIGDMNDTLLTYKPQMSLTPQLQIQNPRFPSPQQHLSNPNNLLIDKIGTLDTNNPNSSLSRNYTPPSLNNDFRRLLDPPPLRSPRVLGNPNLNPNKINDPLERFYR